jgi:energy-coupling factor transport system ATP-binding protein
VAWGAVAITQPEVLLLDEPTRGLDMALKVDLGRLLRSWCAQGRGVLLVTHDVEWAARFADRVVLLAEGRVVADGDPHDVLASHPIFAPQLARLFPGTGVLQISEVLKTSEI